MIKKLLFSKSHIKICDINKCLRCTILQFYSNDVVREKTFRKEDEQYPLTIYVNNNTMKSESKCAYRVNFTKQYWITMLGFSSNRVLDPQ